MTNKVQVVKAVEVTPEYYAQKCPSCNGYGSNGYSKITCRVCGGAGFLKIPVRVVEGGRNDRL